MIRSSARRLAVGSFALALGGLGAIAAQSPAHAADFSADYTCEVPVLGTQDVTIEGSLTASPNPAEVGAPVEFDLQMSTGSLTAPVTINEWSMTADLDVTGAETAQFQVTGSGGEVPTGEPIAGELAGSWTPTAAGTDEIRGGNVTVDANVALLGDITIECTPVDPRPVAETLTVS